MTRIREWCRGSQPFHQIEAELMRGWHTLSIRERRESTWLKPEKDPESKSSEEHFLLIFFGKFKKELECFKRGGKR